MKRTQKTDAFVRVPQHLNDALAETPVSGLQHAIIWVIIRRTYGWGKDEDVISYGHIARMTNRHVRSVVRAMKQLVQRNILVYNDPGKYQSKTWAINEETPTWE